MGIMQRVQQRTTPGSEFLVRLEDFVRNQPLASEPPSSSVTVIPTITLQVPVSSAVSSVITSSASVATMVTSAMQGVAISDSTSSIGIT